MREELAGLRAGKLVQAAGGEVGVDLAVDLYPAPHIADFVPSLGDRQVAAEPLDVPEVHGLGDDADALCLGECLEREQLVLVEDALGKVDPPLDEPRPAVDLVHAHGVGDEVGAIVDGPEYGRLVQVGPPALRLP